MKLMLWRVVRKVNKMSDYIYTSDGELHHHGIIGMKWGVRRYQNKNGTLTAAGKKRYDKEVEKAKKEARILRNRQATANKLKKLEEMKAKNKAKKNALDGKGEPEVQLSGKAAKGKNKKLLKDMSNEEIRARVERIKLENELKSLTPQKVSAGKKFVNSMLDVGKTAVTNIVTDTGKAAVNKWLGLDDSDFKKLEKKSKIAEFKKKIAESEMTQRKNNREKAGEASNVDEKKNNTNPEPEVYGEGTSRRTKKTGPVVDVHDFTDVSPETTARGEGRVVALLEDKRKKKK